MLGPPRHHPRTSSPTAPRARRSSPWARRSRRRVRRRLHRRHLRQLLRAADRHHDDLGSGRRASVQSGSRTVAIAPTPNGTRLLGGRGERHRGRLRLGPELRLAHAVSSTRPSWAWPPPRTAGGYWLVGADGGIFSFGDAAFYGSTGSLRLNKPIVGIASTPDGGGYWMVASDGGIFSFGDAAFYGSMGGRPLNQPIVGIAADPVDRRLLGGGLRRRHLQLRRTVLREHRQHPPQQADRGHGGIARTARATASSPPTAASSPTARRPSTARTGSMSLAAPVVGMAADNATNGYWMAAADGGIFTFGGASLPRPDRQHSRASGGPNRPASDDAAGGQVGQLVVAQAHQVAPHLAGCARPGAARRGGRARGSWPGGGTAPAGGRAR